jgi:hypothetical protein
VTDIPRRVQWHHAAIVSVLCTAFLLFFAGFPQEGDEVTALAIAEQAGDPGRYPQSDLLMVAGERGPYHFYRAIGLLYAANVPVELFWFLGYLIFTAATVVLLWAIAEELGRDTRVATIAAAVVMIANPYRGTLHWFLIPAPNLVTSTAAMPLALWAALMGLRQRFGPAFALSALTFIVHPALGVAAGAATGILMLRERGLGEVRRIAGWVAVSALMTMAGTYFIVSKTPGLAALPPAVPLMSFAEQLRQYAYHVFPADHWREGYAFFLAEVAVAVLLARRFLPESARRLTTLGAVWLALIVLALANTFTINYLPVTLAFPVRVAPFVKAFAWIVTVIGLVSWLRVAPRGWAPIAATGAFAIAALGKNADIAEGFALIGSGIVAWSLLSSPVSWRLSLAAVLGAIGTAEVLAPGWGILRVPAASTAVLDLIRLAGIAAASVLFLVSLAARPVTAPGPAATVRRESWPLTLGIVCAIMILSLALRGKPSAFRPAAPSAIAARVRIGAPDSTLAPVFAWLASTGARGSLLAAPPLDDRFSPVRLSAPSGLYVNAGEVSQLVYDPRLYAEGHVRMLRLGVRLNGPHDFDASAYATLGQDSVVALAKDGVTFAIFPREERMRRPLSLPVAYQDAAWIVYDVRSAR